MTRAYERRVASGGARKERSIAILAISLGGGLWGGRGAKTEKGFASAGKNLNMKKCARIKYGGRKTRGA